MQGIKVERFTDTNGLPIEKLVADLPTPSRLSDLDDEPYSSHAGLAEIDRLLKIRSMRFGRVFGFIQEQKGAIVQNLFPIKSHEQEQISSSSKTVLEMHTETAFHPWRAEVFVLLCIRDDPNAGTTYAELSDIINCLDERIIDHLHQPEFATSLDASFQSDAQANASVRTPVLFDGATSMTYDRNLMSGLNPLAQKSLDAFSHAVEQSTKVIYLKSGESLVINNRTVAHGRTKFRPRYDGTDRWLKRVMVSTRLPNEEQVFAGRDGLPVVTTSF